MTRIIIFGFLVLGVFSCSPKLTPFSSSLLKEYEYDDQALQRIQFYLSDDIVLYRHLKQGQSTIDQGRISIRNGRQVEEIIFREGTPGIYVFSPGKERFALSFERKADHYLIFGPVSQKTRRGYPGNRGIFRLMAKEWSSDHGVITYGGKEYFTPASSAYVSLLVDIEEKSQVNRRVKEVGGRTVR